MACVAMDTSFPDSDQAVELGRRLNERLAWCHALRLWAWGIDQGREDGTFHLDDKRIAEISSFRGDAHEFVEAMVGVGLLVRQDDGSYYMSGWSRNKEYFSKKRRMKNYRERQKNKGEASLETPKETSPETSQETHSLSRSLSLSLLDTQVTAEQAIRELSSPPHSWKPARLPDEQRIASVCPVTRSVFEASVRDTEANASKPGFAYFASVLEGAVSGKKQRSRDPTEGGRIGYHPGGRPEEFVDGEVKL